MSHNIEKQKNKIIAHALTKIVPIDYGVYVSSDKLFITDFYKLEKKTGGIVIIVYSKGLYDEQKNQFTVICVHRKLNSIVWCNTQGLVLNCQAYEVLCNLQQNNKYFACTQLRYKCENNELLNNMAFMFYLVEMISNRSKFGEIPPDNDIIARYTSIIPREFVQSVYSDMNPA